MTVCAPPVPGTGVSEPPAPTGAAPTGAAPTIGAATWRALGTYVQLQVATPEALAESERLARAVLAEVDRACSRFRGDSDLVRANAAAGEWVVVNPILVGAVRAAVWAAETTDGLVDPCLGDVLVAAGYDRTFTDVRAARDPGAVHVVPLPSPGAWRDLEVREAAVRVPRGVSLDLGATGKAYAADLVALTLTARVGVPAVVSVGGDVRVAGSAEPKAEPVAWPVDVAPDLAALDDPDTPVCRVFVTEGGLATSSITARRWIRAGRSWHHVVDPRTAQPTDGTWRAVTAYGPSACAANATTTAALVLGSAAPEWLARRDIAARLVARDGSVRHTPRWEREAKRA